MSLFVIAGCVLVALVLLASRVSRDDTISMPTPDVKFDTSEEVDSLIRSGQKIGAIKLLRRESGLGLREAKEQVERREQELTLA